MAQKDRSDELERQRVAERQAVAELIAERDMEQRRLAQQQGQFDSDLRQRQVEFSGGLEIDQRRQRLAEANSEADAILGDRRAETDRLSVLGRNENYRRQNDFRDSQPTDIDVLRERFALEQAERGEAGGLLPHQRGEWLAKSTGLFEDQVAGLRETIANAPLTEEGKRVWGELSGELRSIEQQRDFLRPDQYNQALGQWLDKAQRSRLDSMVQPSPTAGDVIGQQYDPQTGIFVQQDSQGRWQARPLLSAEDQRREIALKEKELEWKMRGGEGGGDTMSSAARAESISGLDKDALGDLRKRASEAIMSRRMASAGDQAPSEVITPQELFAEMNRMFEEERQLNSLIQSQMTYSEWSQKQDMPARVPERFMQQAGMGAAQTPMQSEDDIMSPSDVLPGRGVGVAGSIGSELPAATQDEIVVRPPTRSYTPSPGTLTPQETEARKQMIRMSPRERVEMLKEFHPETRGKTIEEIMNMPGSREAYENLRKQGALKDGTYEDHAIAMIDDFLVEETGVLSGTESFVGMSVSDIEDPELKGLAAELPKPKSLAEAEKLNSRYFVDPTGVIRQRF
ncbi:MAG: hypothetical protein AAFV88_04410 [Planctomycetota bacterium]